MNGDDATGDASPVAGGTTTGDDRGVTPILAFVLLTAMVAVVSVGLLVAGGVLLEEGKGTAEEERVRNGMVELGSDVDGVAASDGDTRVVDLDLPDDGRGFVRKEESGRIVVTRYDGTDSEVINRSIGSLVYEHDGTVYAYEAGAVWRGTGRGTRMVSAPDVTYHGATLTLPITDLEGDDGLSSDRVRVRKRETVAPLSDVEMVRGDLITVRVTSDHYGGWARYFRQRIDDVTVEVDHANRTVVAHLADPSIEGDFATGLVAAGDVNATNPSQTPNTTVRTTGNYSGDVVCADGAGDDCVETVESTFRSLDVAIEVRARAAKRDDATPSVSLSGGETLDAGSYYVPGDVYLDGTDNLTLDLSEGDVTLVLDGNLGLKNTNLRVVNGAGTDNYARIYLNHTDMAIGNKAGVAVESGNASRMQVYGTSDTHFAMGQANDVGFTGVVYAPRGEPAGGVNDAVEDMNLDNADCPTDMCLGKGSGNVTGAIIGGDLTIGQNVEFEYDTDLSGVDPTMDRQGVFPPEITYLHVSVTTVEIAEDE